MHSSASQSAQKICGSETTSQWINLNKSQEFSGKGRGRKLNHQMLWNYVPQLYLHTSSRRGDYYPEFCVHNSLVFLFLPSISSDFDIHDLRGKQGELMCIERSSPTQGPITPYFAFLLSFFFTVIYLKLVTLWLYKIAKYFQTEWSSEIIYT